MTVVQLTKSPGQQAMLPTSVRDQLGANLRLVYGAPEADTAAMIFGALLVRLDQALAARGEALTAEVRAGIITNLPSLRTFALSLTRNQPSADDLVQTTLLKAWQARAKYAPDTKLAAWLFTIMRNAFYSEHRRGRLEVEDPDEVYQAMASVAPTQGHGLDVADMRAALERLPVEQREALVLVTVEEMSYDEAAGIMKCKVGTIKSRVSRARAQLHKLLDYSSDDFRLDDTTKAVIGRSANT